MFGRWIISDIEVAGRKSDRIVISDPGKFLTFMVRELTDYAVITLNTPDQEMNARHQAMTAHRDSKVIFLCFFPKKEIRQLIEFAGIGGYIELDNPDRYIRKKLYHEGLGNVTLPEPKLLLAAKLSGDKDLTWWKGIINETIKPLNLREHLSLLITNPKQYQDHHDEMVYSVLRDELCKIMDKATTPIDAPTLLRELANTLFRGLAYDNINSNLLEIYEWWSNDNALMATLRNLASSWCLPADVSPLKANPDHPFESIDCELMVIAGLRLNNDSTLADLCEAIRLRIKSHRALEFKAKWLPDLLALLEFDSSDLYRYDSLPKITEYYRKCFAPLDSAMRHLYAVWLGEPKLLRPLQELYESHLKALLGIWFAIGSDKYKPNQLSLIEKALGADRKTAVIVCDGLRLEIAETIANRLPKSVETTREIRNAKLPSVTENGMSALFGLDEAVNSTITRFDCLRRKIAGVEIINHIGLGLGISSKKLVVMYGDIDQAGEHKGLAGLRDINNYETELAETINLLHRLGYADIYITADHGFVITGLLADASKVPAPAGVVVKERFLLSDDFISHPNLIRREDKFPGGHYQYYAKTDRPFRSRGAYGYSHGGFTPQECLIPFYRFSTKEPTASVEVSISNKEALSEVTGLFFTVKLKGNDVSVGLRLKVSLYSNGSLATQTIVKMDEEGNGTVEFETLDSNMTLLVQDTTTGNQLDSAPVKKSTSRDLDDLF